MAQEQNQKCSNSSSGGGGADGGGGGAGGSNGVGGGCSKSSKKMIKPKKVPQRGLGVAQLERIRLEEQQKKDPSMQHVPIFPSNPLLSPNSSQGFNLQCVPNFRHNPSSPSIPMPPPPPPPGLNSVFRNEFPNPSTIVLPKHPNGTGMGMGMEWPQGNWSQFRNGDYINHGGDKPRPPDHHQGFGFRGNGNPAYEPNPIWNSPSLLQRTQQFQQQQQQPFSSSSMVNNGSSGTGTGTSSSSGTSYHQIEPPPIQSLFFGGNYTPMGPEEDRAVMVGGKRPYPFLLSDIAGPTFPGKIPRTACGGDGESSMNRDFLSLASPAATGSRSTLHNGIQEPEENSRPETLLFPILRAPEPLYSIFPRATARTDEAAASGGGATSNGEAGEELDLDLKL